MKITVELSPEIEVRLRERAAQGDTDAVRTLLVEALTPTVEALLQEAPANLSDALFESLTNELTNSFEPNTPPLSDYAVSRAGIYADHP